MTTLFPEIEPFNHGYIQVSDIHNVYYEEVGNPEGGWEDEDYMFEASWEEEIWDDSGAY